MDNKEELRDQIEHIINRNKDDVEFLRWALLHVKTVERWRMEDRTKKQTGAITIKGRTMDIIKDNTSTVRLSSADRDAQETKYIIKRNANNSVFLHKLLVRAILLEKLYRRN